MSGIGQSSVTASPLQMAMVVAGIANDGKVMRPYLVDEVRAPNASLLDKTSASNYSEAVSSSTAALHSRPTRDRPTPGSSPSRQQTTRRWLSPYWSRQARPTARRSLAAGSAARSPRRSWRR